MYWSEASGVVTPRTVSSTALLFPSNRILARKAVLVFADVKPFPISAWEPVSVEAEHVVWLLMRTN